MSDARSYTLTDFNPSGECAWCGKSVETLNATDSSGFLVGAPLCFKCLAKAVGIAHRGKGSQTARLNERQLG